jgi:hypothetical protein
MTHCPLLSSIDPRSQGRYAERRSRATEETVAEVAFQVAAGRGDVTSSMETDARSSRRPHWFPRVVAVLGGVSFLASGLWAMVGPESFFEMVATFEPYNPHFVQDIGAFQIGLGAVLLLASIPTRTDALAVGLVGVGIGSVAHTVSHVIGRDLGGTPELDIPLTALMSLLLLVGGLWRWRQ